MISIGIIVPTWHYFANPFKLQPLNELYIATILDEDSSGLFDVNVIDYREKRRNKQFHIPRKDVYLYWITKSADYIEIIELVKSIKALFPESTHIAGGTHIENFVDESSENFDAIIIGPIEQSIKSALLNYKNKKLNKQYFSKWEDNHYSKFSFCKRHFLAREAIVNTELFEKYNNLLATSVLFSRGCNFKCAFCSYNVPNCIQRKSQDQIREEIEYLKEIYHIKAINLRDEIAIPLIEKEAIAFLKAMKDSKIIWRGQTRVGSTLKIMQFARDSGCVELAIGVESAFQEVLDKINKKQNLKQVEEFFDICKKLDIKTKMCLIIGLPKEPKNIVDITKKFIEKINPNYVNISGFCPMPGSDTYKNPLKYGIETLEEDWNKYFHLMFRFSDEETFGIPFKYIQNTQNFTRRQIVKNILDLQHFVKERKMVY